MSKKKEYRITWRHEIHFLADSDEDARNIWENTDLGLLKAEVVSGYFIQEGYVEAVSFECVSEDYREVLFERESTVEDYKALLIEEKRKKKHLEVQLSNLVGALRLCNILSATTIL